VIFILRCKYMKRLVGERGFEPPTPWSRTRFCTSWKSVEIRANTNIGKLVGQHAGLATRSTSNFLNQRLEEFSSDCIVCVTVFFKCRHVDNGLSGNVPRFGNLRTNVE